MRAIDNKMKIKVVKLKNNPPSVDTMEDLKKFVCFLKIIIHNLLNNAKKIYIISGLHGAYSDLVCRKFYKDYLTLPCNSFEEAISAVENKKADVALIPVENNIAGRVADMHLLEKINLKIVAEHYHKIEHHLMTKENINLSKIQKVFSHIHALNQCKKNIRKLNISPVNFIDTAGAAKYISETKTTNSAAIASKLASEIYNLKIVKNNMQDSKITLQIFSFLKKSKKIGFDKKVITSIVLIQKTYQHHFTKLWVVLLLIQLI